MLGQRQRGRHSAGSVPKVYISVGYPISAPLHVGTNTVRMTSAHVRCVSDEPTHVACVHT
jgi:hypothetical protein